MKRLLLILALSFQVAAIAQITDSAYIWVNGLSISHLYNSDNYYEQIQNPWPYNNTTRVPLLHPKSQWKSFTGSFEYFVGVRGDGSLWTWHTNPDKTRAPILNPIPNLKQDYEQVVFASGIFWVYGITTSGHLYAVSTSGIELPMDTVNSIKKVTRGSYAGSLVVLRSDFTIWRYFVGQSGNFNGPTQLGPTFKWIDVAACSSFFYGLREDGTLWRVNNTVPTPSHQEGADSNWVSIHSEGSSLFGLQSNGTLWGQGNNQFGQLGIGTTQYAQNITQVGKDTDWVRVIPGIHHTFAFKSNGELYGWGRNGASQIGDNTYMSRSAPVLVGAPDEFIDAYPGDENSVYLRAWGFEGKASGLSVENLAPSTLHLNVFPNPATHYISAVNLPVNAAVVAIDVTGAIVFKTITHTPELLINTQQWPRGHYILRLTHQNQMVEEKLILY